MFGKLIFSIPAVLVLWLAVFVPVRAGNSLPDTAVINALTEQWLVYDVGESSYFPFLKDVHRDARQIYLQVNAQAYRGLYLSIFGKAGAHLFLNNKLCFSFEKDQWFSFPLDSLGRPAGRAAAAPLLLLAYHRASQINAEPEVYITLRRYVSVPAPKKVVSPTPAKGRRVYQQRDFMIVASLLVLFVMAVLSRIDKPMLNINQVVKSLELFWQGKTQIKRLQAPHFVVFLLYYGFTFAFVIVFISTYLPEFSFRASLTPGPAFLDGISTYLIVFLGVVLSVVLKYLGIGLMGTLFNDRQMPSVHFQEFMNISQIFCTLILIVMILANAALAYLSPQHLEGLVYFIAACLLIQCALISYRLNKFTTYKKIYLFSYLCATEYVPLLVSAKIFLVL